MSEPDAAPTAGDLDGRAVTADELRALALTNYGHFTTMRVQDHRVRGLGLHLDRLVRDCRLVFGVDLDAARVRRLVRHAVPAGGPAVMVRVTVFDPKLPLAHPGGPSRPSVLVTTRPVEPSSSRPLRLSSVAYRRDLPTVKHTGLFGALHHRRVAQADGFDDVLFVDPPGTVSEGATWNVGFVRDGRVTFPAADCLPGVTLRLVRQVLDERGIGYDTAPVALAGISAGTAAFVTNAAVGVRPVRRIDDVPLADSPLVATLAQAYADIPGEPL